jgi:hypothetical protein
MGWIISTVALLVFAIYQRGELSHEQRRSRIYRDMLDRALGEISPLDPPTQGPRQ